MKNLSGILSLISLLFFVTACGHHRDVRPGAKGINRVVVKAEDQSSGARNALDQANHYCKEFNRRAVILDENSKYTGDMDEKTYKNMKKASKVAKTISGSTYGTGGANQRARRGPGVNMDEPSTGLGDVTGLGGNMLNDMAGEGYSVHLRFRCE